MPPDFLISLLARYSQQPPSIRPNVTLTFAQSTDAKIAAIPGKQLILSADESIQMTHCLRSMHDAILVGIGTALNDDPQLNSGYRPHHLCTLTTPPTARHLPPRLPPHNVPRPIILDSHLRLPTSCKLLNNFRAGSGRRPWILSTPSQDPSWISRKEALKQAGANIIEIPSLNGNSFSLNSSPLVRYLSRSSFHSRSSAITPRS